MKVIIVSGSVGTGKTSLAKLISKQTKAEYVDVNKLIKENKLYSKYNKKFDTFEVDVDNLVKFLIKVIKNSKKSLVLDSHLIHYLPASKVDLCFITKCNLKILKKRLEKRNYSKLKVRENLDAEIFDVCVMEALVNKHKIVVVDTSKGLKGFKVSKYL